ncbi:MAG: serine/threonine-protein kinase, partial [Planctomycetales bacterium]
MGCLLFQMITGRVPFVGLNAADKMAARQSQTPPPLHQLRPETPPPLEEIVNKMLARDPDRRYQSPEAVAEALRPFTVSESGATGSGTGTSSGTTRGATFRKLPLEELFETLEQQKLLEPDEVARLREETPPDSNTQSLISELVSLERLTSWQQLQLVTGNNEFHLGKYKLLELLGKGGTGDVFKGQDSSGSLFALKVLSEDQQDDEEVLARFHREARLAAVLNHPNIVNTHAAAREGDRLCLVMEYVEGNDLNHWIEYFSKRRKQLPFAWSCECVRQAALGLHHAFEREVVHRDVKPSNILVIGQDASIMPVVKILDMGAATAHREDLKGASITRDGELLGTPDYMAPEQVYDPTNADVRSDIYSLGCTLFHLLAGRVPFQPTSGGAIAKLTIRLKEAAPRIRAIRKEVPEELELLLASMLEREADKRPQTPGEVAERLEPFTQNVAAPSPIRKTSSVALTAIPSSSSVSAASSSISAASTDEEEMELDNPSTIFGDDAREFEDSEDAERSTLIPGKTPPPEHQGPEPPLAESAPLADDDDSL